MLRAASQLLAVALVALSYSPELEVAALSPVRESNKGEVRVLTDANFEHTESFAKSEAAGLFVIFYAPWCGHSKRIMPHFERAAHRLTVARLSSSSEVSVTPVMARLDASLQTATAKRLKVRHYPAIIWLRADTEPLMYEAEATDEALVEFITRVMAGGVVADTSSAQEREKRATLSVDPSLLVVNDRSLDQALSDHTLLVVMFYAPWCQHCKQLMPKYKAVRSMLRKQGSDYVLSVLDAEADDGQATARKYDIRAYPTIRVYAGGVEVAQYEQAHTTQGLASFLTSNEQKWLDEFY